MDSAVYKMIELTGTSSINIEDAINIAIINAAKTLRNLEWFEVIQVRGILEQNMVRQYQVILKIGFRVEERSA